MKRILIRLMLAVAVCCTASLSSSGQRLPEAPLTNAAVIKLVRAGFKEKTVIAIIHSRLNRFNLDSDRLIELKRNGVGENIILAMLAQDESFVLSEDEWTTNSIFRGKRPGGSDPGDQSEGSDVFGSSGGSKRQRGGRGMSGANEEETTTTGSATVRILRPPSEASGNALKLEKTPTLTNDAVIKLVEAGFSEGTIIKRIEDSPAEFDLSSVRVEELRRRRVSDAIIAAMTAAMSDESDLKRTASPKAKGN
jgi:hypothetical protein